MQNLIKSLTEQTQSLKVQFLEMTAEWATIEFNTLTNMTNEQIDDKWGYYNEHSRRASKMSESKKSHSIKRIKWDMQFMGIEQYISKTLESATEHYENSIIKLAQRIEAKGLNVDNLTMQTSHIGVNIETTITDGAKKVKAQTIIASGEIQKPHYRYLVK